MAGKIPEEVINHVRTSVNISDVISDYVQLHKQGRNLFGSCPWHDEKTPSFSVNEQKQIFHCFSCGRGGNVFQFLVEMKNLSFPDAVLEVANIANISIDSKYVQLNKQPVYNKNHDLYNLYTQAAKLYHHMLMNTNIGQEALDYLHNRGLEDDTLDLFNLGYAPKTSILLPYFQEKGIDINLLKESELFFENEDGTLRDRFINRVLFTIKNEDGQVIAFSGRSLKKDEKAKYINSPESKLFNKSNELFNFDLAKSSIKRNKSVILFEGFMDVIAAYSAGVTSGVASMGTSLTYDQVKKISRVANKILIAYDGDTPGQQATKRAIELIEQTNSNIDIQIINLPDNLDPDEYLRKFGKDAFVNAVEHGLETPISFAMRYLKQGRNLDNEAEKLKYLDDVLNELAKVENAIERDLQINQLASQFGVGVDSLKIQLNNLRKSTLKKTNVHTSINSNDNYQVNFNNQVGGVKSRADRAERTLLLWMLHDKDVWQLVTSNVDFHFTKLTHETLFILAQAYWTTHSVYNLGEFFDYINEPSLSKALSDLENDSLISKPDMTMVKELVDLIMYKVPLTQLINEKKQELQDAKRLGNNELLLTLTNDYINLLRQKQQTS